MASGTTPSYPHNRSGLFVTSPKGCLSRKTALAMAFKLILSAKQKWRKLDGSNQLAQLVEGVPFKDGIKITKHAA